MNKNFDRVALLYKISYTAEFKSNEPALFQLNHIYKYFQFMKI